jgi:hypothetical protein
MKHFLFPIAVAAASLGLASPSPILAQAANDHAAQIAAATPGRPTIPQYPKHLPKHPSKLSVR